MYSNELTYYITRKDGNKNSDGASRNEDRNKNVCVTVSGESRVRIRTRGSYYEE